MKSDAEIMPGTDAVSLSHRGADARPWSCNAWNACEWAGDRTQRAHNLNVRRAHINAGQASFVYAPPVLMYFTASPCQSVVCFTVIDDICLSLLWQEPDIHNTADGSTQYDSAGETLRTGRGMQGTLSERACRTGSSVSSSTTLPLSGISSYAVWLCRNSRTFLRVNSGSSDCITYTAGECHGNRNPHHNAPLTQWISGVQICSCTARTLRALHHMTARFSANSCCAEQPLAATVRRSVIGEPGPDSACSPGPRSARRGCRSRALSPPWACPRRRWRRRWRSAPVHHSLVYVRGIP